MSVSKFKFNKSNLFLALIVAFMIWLIGIFDFGSIVFKKYEIIENKTIRIVNDVSGWPYGRGMTSYGAFYTIRENLKICSDYTCTEYPAEKSTYSNQVVLDHLIANRQKILEVEFDCKALIRDINNISGAGETVKADLTITKYPTIFSTRKYQRKCHLKQ